MGEIKLNEAGNSYQIVDGIHDSLLDWKPGTATPRDLLIGAAERCGMDPAAVEQDDEWMEYARDLIASDGQMFDQEGDK